MADSDDNGINDYNEDQDGDGLTNGQEFNLGTDPTLEDTDFDGLDDFVETKQYSTDPTSVDTDNDGAKDGWEVENGYDPKSFNSSFTVNIPASAPNQGTPITAGVTANIEGNSTGTLAVTPIGAIDNPMLNPSISGYLGQAYDFSVNGDISNATITFRYDSSLGNSGEAFQPRIYYYNEEKGTLEEVENQSVSEGQVSATISHFSTYILLNKVDYEAVWESDIKPPFSSAEEGEDAELDIAFVIDYSYSMENNDPEQLCKQLSKGFISKLRDGKDKAAVIKFIRRATVVSELTDDKEELYAAIDSISYDNGYGSYSGTDGSAGLKAALDSLSASNSKYLYVVFITDGEDNGYSYSYDSLINEAIDMGVVVYTVGMGNATESILMRVAESTNGKYFHSTTSVETEDLINLDDVFEEIESETVDLTTDTNNDGIPDYYNNLILSGELLLSNGASFKGVDFNYNSDGNTGDDFDGDGLKNGEELKIVNEGDRVYLEMYSDPTMIHSDSDGIDDYQEVQNGTDPLYAQERFAVSDVDYLFDNDNYNYESFVDMYDDNKFFQFDSAFLAAIYGVWNIREIFRDILVNYMDEYVESIDDSTEEDARDQLLRMSYDTLGRFSRTQMQNAEDTAEIGNYVDLFFDLKGLISDLNGTEEVTMTVLREFSVRFTTLVRQIAIYDPSIGTVTMETHKMSSTTVSIVTDKVTIPSSILLGFSIGMNVLEGSIDINDTMETFAKIDVNHKVFEQNMNLLTQLRDYGGRKAMQGAADDVLKELAKQYGAQIHAVTGDAGELTLNVLITLVATNPYIGAVKVVRDVIGVITGIKDELKEEYELLTYNCLADGTLRLILRSRFIRGSYYYDTTDGLRRYLFHLAQIRVLGEQKYEAYYTHFWDSNKDETRAMIANSINRILSHVHNLGLVISSKLDNSDDSFSGSGGSHSFDDDSGNGGGGGSEW